MMATCGVDRRSGHLRRSRPGTRCLVSVLFLSVALFVLALTAGPAATLPADEEGDPQVGHAATLAADEEGDSQAQVPSNQSMAAQAVEWARKAGGGPLSVVFIGLAEVVAILICLPGYSTIEYAAGAIFGFFWGSIIVGTAKSLAALIAFALITTLRDSAWGRWAQQRVLAGDRNGGLAVRIQQGIKQNGFTFSLMVRCSPLPAWLSNYALPLAGVPFPTYIGSSVIGMLPPVLTNVYAGALAATVAATLSGGNSTAGSGGAVGLIAVGISVVSSTLLVHQLSRYSPDEEATSSQRVNLLEEPEPEARGSEILHTKAGVDTGRAAAEAA